MSSADGDIWSEGSLQQVVSRVRELGFPSVSAYLRAFPGEGYDPLARRLGGDVAMVQLLLLLVREGMRAGQLRSVAKETLARELLTQQSEGWGVGSEFLAHLTGAMWISGMVNAGAGEAIGERLHAVWRALREGRPPVGWKPQGGVDPIIGAAFDRAWPADAPS